MNRALALAAIAVAAVGCGGHSSMMAPSAPSVVSAPVPAPGSISTTSSATGTWTGTGTDSSSPMLGTGGMMGQAAMGTATWRLTQDGSHVAGLVTFEGMHGPPGTLTGTMSGDHMTFTIDMPANGMMGSPCSTQAAGIAHMDPATKTMNCTYSGTHSCAGAYTNGQMLMTRR